MTVRPIRIAQVQAQAIGVRIHPERTTCIHQRVMRGVSKPILINPNRRVGLMGTSPQIHEHNGEWMTQTQRLVTQGGHR